MTRLDSLFHRPRPMRIVLQKFFVMTGFDDKRLNLTQAFHNHFCRVAKIGDESETARACVKSKPKRIDSVMRHWKCLHGHVADAELGAGAKDSPVAMLLEQFVAPNRLRRKRVAINRHLQFATKNFESANVIAVFVSEKHAIQLIGRDAALSQ